MEFGCMIMSLCRNGAIYHLNSQYVQNMGCPNNSVYALKYRVHSNAQYIQ